MSSIVSSSLSLKWAVAIVALRHIKGRFPIKKSKNVMEFSMSGQTPPPPAPPMMENIFLILILILINFWEHVEIFVFYPLKCQNTSSFHKISWAKVRGLVTFLKYL